MSATRVPTYELSHLRELEAESVHLLREVAAQFDRPVLLSLDDMGSAIMAHVAGKAFWPGRVPFSTLRVDGTSDVDEAIADGQYDAVLDATRSDDQQIPDLWNLHSGRCGPGRYARVFPLRCWTELDAQHYASEEGIRPVEDHR